MLNRDRVFIITLSIVLMASLHCLYSEAAIQLNDRGYFEKTGFNLMVFDDFYPEGHQGGVSLILHGNRIASNGDIRLSPTPGQWHPLPRIVSRHANPEDQSIMVQMAYPDSARMNKGFNPLPDSDIHFKYTITVQSLGSSLAITVLPDRSFPAKFCHQIGFHLELFPGALFGKSFIMDQKPGLFPRQFRDDIHNGMPRPLACGKLLSIAPETQTDQFIIKSLSGTMELIDGRAKHNNGWFIVRETFSAPQKPVQWIIEPHILPDWQAKPVIQYSQIGYHPDQKKNAVIELDASYKSNIKAALYQIKSRGERVKVFETVTDSCMPFLRYQYRRFDFTSIHEPGLYQIEFGKTRSNIFPIDDAVYHQGVWQPTLLSFLPVQMCHMRVNDRYRVWHDLCHIDDALMAPVNHNHFDGYRQKSSTLCSFKPFEPVPGLNRGGWHDAGDYDLRVESQIGTVFMLSLAAENFNVDIDQTAVDQTRRLVEMHQADGKSDILQQIEHGVLSILGGYQSLGRLYRGIICSDLRQYVMLGDGGAMTDNQIETAPSHYSPTDNTDKIAADDRWVFTEENPRRELGVIPGLLAAHRVLTGFNDTLAVQCLQTARQLYAPWQSNDKVRLKTAKIAALCEFIITNQSGNHEQQLIECLPLTQKEFSRTCDALARAFPFFQNSQLKDTLTELAETHAQVLSEAIDETPYGVPYRPHIWGAGWGIQRNGVKHYFLHQAWPHIYDKTYYLNALEFVLGRHPGSNNASLVSGVGAHSITTAYGVNRADWSYIPGGVVSGTALIRPDFPELKEWPFFWQQTEYVLGGGATHFMFLALAAQAEFE